MDFSKPPKKPLIMNVEIQYTRFQWLHPSMKTRLKFYKEVLLPLGHVQLSPEGLLEKISEELYEAVKEKDPALQAWVNLIA
jgi:hypothetical protein